MATLLLASDKDVSKVVVFIAASLAQVVSAGLAVVVGTVGQYLPEAWIRHVAGVGFIAIGLWTLISA